MSLAGDQSEVENVYSARILFNWLSLTFRLPVSSDKKGCCRLCKEKKGGVKNDVG